eukprot:COSAG04_NODE_916_length_9432_cov_11.719383_4_plen_211_part_00
MNVFGGATRLELLSHVHKPRSGFAAAAPLPPCWRAEGTLGGKMSSTGTGKCYCMNRMNTTARSETSSGAAPDRAVSGVVTRTTGLRGYLCEGHLAIKSSTGAAPLPRHVTWGLASRVHVTFWRRQLAAAPLLRRRFGRERGVVSLFGGHLHLRSSRKLAERGCTSGRCASSAGGNAPSAVRLCGSRRQAGRAARRATRPRPPARRPTRSG